MFEITVYEHKTFKNKLLEDTTNAIAETGTAYGEALKRIAVMLNEVSEKAAYKEDGFETVVDYAEQTFGWKKSMTYNLVKTGGLLKKHAAELEGYTVSQIQELLPCKGETLEKVIDTVSPDMTAKEIRSAVSGVKAKKTTRTPAKYLFTPCGIDVAPYECTKENALEKLDALEIEYFTHNGTQHAAVFYSDGTAAVFTVARKPAPEKVKATDVKES